MKRYGNIFLVPTFLPIIRNAIDRCYAKEMDFRFVHRKPQRDTSYKYYLVGDTYTEVDKLPLREYISEYMNGAYASVIFTYSDLRLYVFGDTLLEWDVMGYMSVELESRPENFRFTKDKDEWGLYVKESVS